MVLSLELLHHHHSFPTFGLALPSGMLVNHMKDLLLIPIRSSNYKPRSSQ